MVSVPSEFTLGVEEEYLLVDKETGALVVDPPDSLMKACEDKLGEQVASELLRSQIEIGTQPLTIGLKGFVHQEIVVLVQKTIAPDQVRDVVLISQLTPFVSPVWMHFDADHGRTFDIIQGNDWLILEYKLSRSQAFL